jgi:hypothetical protein
VTAARRSAKYYGDVFQESVPPFCFGGRGAKITLTITDPQTPLAQIQLHKPPNQLITSFFHIKSTGLAKR